MLRTGDIIVPYHGTNAYTVKSVEGNTVTLSRNFRNKHGEWISSIRTISNNEEYWHIIPQLEVKPGDVVVNAISIQPTTRYKVTEVHGERMVLVRLKQDKPISTSKNNVLRDSTSWKLIPSQEIEVVQ